MTCFVPPDNCLDREHCWRQGKCDRPYGSVTCTQHSKTLDQYCGGKITTLEIECTNTHKKTIEAAIAQSELFPGEYLATMVKRIQMLEEEIQKLRSEQ